MSAESPKETGGIGLDFFHGAGLANSHEIRSLGKRSRAGSILTILNLPSMLLKKKKESLVFRNPAKAVSEITEWLGGTPDEC